MKKFAGLDVHSKRCVFVLMNQKGEEIARGDFATTPAGIRGWVKEHKLEGRNIETKVGMESCHMAALVYRELLKAGLSDLVVVDAGEVRAKARKRNQKSDYADAADICDGVRRDQYVKLVQMPDAFSYELRQLLMQRRHFVRVQTREVNSVKSALRREGLVHIYKTMKSKVSFQRLLKKRAIPAALKARIVMHMDLWLTAETQVVAIDAKLQAHCEDKAPTLEVLQSMPGVGPITSMTMIAYVQDADRFSSAKQAASYAGLVPQTFHSADTERYGHITKSGPKELRSMLVEAAHQARRKSHPLNRFLTRLTIKRGYKVAIVAVAHKICRMLFAMLRDGAAYNPRKLGIEDKWQELEALHA